MGPGQRGELGGLGEERKVSGNLLLPVALSKINVYNLLFFVVSTIIYCYLQHFASVFVLVC